MAVKIGVDVIGLILFQIAVVGNDHYFKGKHKPISKHPYACKHKKNQASSN